ncbi:hypothetical protein I551_8987 [Mycobacterium ulcerans str. Harvey]|uniref:Uncharacterized protein n=1 Tax=Mycobacterium ulcerans str. Harvey TaxID=1299332 RepID=A0ABN0R9B7_MYCUL|nr:hypothetical protein I551_8987 [Mycobacterium ulcerans str. Harvey]
MGLGLCGVGVGVVGDEVGVGALMPNEDTAAVRGWSVLAIGWAR